MLTRLPRSLAGTPIYSSLYFLSIKQFSYRKIKPPLPSPSLTFKPYFSFAKLSKKEKEKQKDKDEKKKIKQEIGSTSQFDLNVYEEQYDEIVENFREAISKLKTGRLDQSFFANVYAKIGNKNEPIQQVAEIAPRSSNVVVFHPYDSDNLDSIEKSLQASDFGFQIARVQKTIVVTQLANTANELKKKYLEKLKKETQNAKDKVNKTRNQARNDIKKFKKIIMEDRIKQIEAQVKSQNQKYMNKIEKLASTKQKELSK